MYPMWLYSRAKFVILTLVLIASDVMLSSTLARSQNEMTYTLNPRYQVGQQTQYRMKITQRATTVGVQNDRIWRAEFQCEEQILEMQDDGTILLSNTLTDLIGTVRGGDVDYNYNRLPTSALRPTDEGFQTESAPVQQMRKIMPSDIEGTTFLISLSPQGEIRSVSCQDSTVSQHSIRLVHTWLTDAYLPISQYPKQVGDTWSSIRDRAGEDEERISRFTKVRQSRHLAEIQESAHSPNCIVYFWEVADRPHGASKIARDWQVNVNTGQVHRMKVEAESYTTEPFGYRKSGVRDQRISKSTVTTHLERTVIE